MISCSRPSVQVRKHGSCAGCLALLVKGKPVRAGIAVLSVEPIEVNRAAVDPWRRASLEAFSSNANTVKDFRQLNRRGFARPAGRHLRVQTQMNPSPEERPCGHDDGAT